MQKHSNYMYVISPEKMTGKYKWEVRECSIYWNGKMLFHNAGRAWL